MESGTTAWPSETVQNPYQPPPEPGDVGFDRSSGEREALAAGVSVDESGEIDFFGSDNRDRYFLPGTNHRQWIEYRELREGELKRYQSMVSRDVILQRTSGDAKMRIDPGEDRHALIRAAVTGWQLFRAAEAGGKGVAKGEMIAVPFTQGELNQVLTSFPGKIIAELEEAIRKLNPSLTNDMTVEDIDKAIEALQAQREEIVQRQGKETA